ncbi:MAG: YbjN domain-containing protein [Deltaproteobacteria bacterium]|nr:YbjN domain-containing protein [Deltaproteobacteria bacterium]
MADNDLLPVTLATFQKLLVESGLEAARIEEERGCVTFDYAGQNSPLRMSVIAGKVQPDQDPWFARFLTYSLTFEPIKAGIGTARLHEWLNEKNADVFFGRFYHDEATDTVVFEVSIPCAAGVNPVDFRRMTEIALLFVDRVHSELKTLAAPVEVDG